VGKSSGFIHAVLALELKLEAASYGEVLSQLSIENLSGIPRTMHHA
jgi:hypothetical protein